AEMTEKLAAEILDRSAAAARAHGVECDTLSKVNDLPYEAIIETADDKGCDLIYMASHGRRGLVGLLLGSETQKVLTHSTIPVLVYRSPEKASRLVYAPSRYRQACAAR